MVTHMFASECACAWLSLPSANSKSLSGPCLLFTFPLSLFLLLVFYASSPLAIPFLLFYDGRFAVKQALLLLLALSSSLATTATSTLLAGFDSTLCDSSRKTNDNCSQVVPNLLSRSAVFCNDLETHNHRA